MRKTKRAGVCGTGTANEFIFCRMHAGCSTQIAAHFYFIIVVGRRLVQKAQCTASGMGNELETVRNGFLTPSVRLMK